MTEQSIISTARPSRVCDSHFHVLGPPDVYPPRPGHAYALELSELSDYFAAVEPLGIRRHVIVQPSIYGTDNRCMLDAMSRAAVGTVRGIAVIDDGTDDATLKKMNAAGIRGIRFNLVHGNQATPDEILTSARRVARLGWHLELYVTGELLPDLTGLLNRLPTPFVIDHMGQIVPGSPQKRVATNALMRLLELGHSFVKLIGYRSSASGYPFSDVLPLMKVLAARFPDRCLWGSDWPNLNIAPKAPVPAELLEAFRAAVPSAELQRQILVDNPQSVYGFE